MFLIQDSLLAFWEMYFILKEASLDGVLQPWWLMNAESGLTSWTWESRCASSSLESWTGPAETLKKSHLHHRSEPKTKQKKNCFCCHFLTSCFNVFDGIDRRSFSEDRSVVVPLLSGQIKDVRESSQDWLPPDFCSVLFCFSEGSSRQREGFVVLYLKALGDFSLVLVGDGRGDLCSFGQTILGDEPTWRFRDQPEKRINQWDCWRFDVHSF